MDYSFFDFLRLIGSLGLFLYGMKIMSEGLQKFAGDSLRKILTAMTTNRVTGGFHRGFDYGPDPIIFRHHSHGGQFRKRRSAHSYPIHRSHNGSQYRYDCYRLVDLGSRF